MWRNKTMEVFFIYPLKISYEGRTLWKTIFIFTMIIMSRENRCWWNEHFYWIWGQAKDIHSPSLPRTFRDTHLPFSTNTALVGLCLRWQAHWSALYMRSGLLIMQTSSVISWSIKTYLETSFWCGPLHQVNKRPSIFLYFMSGLPFSTV